MLRYALIIVLLAGLSSGAFAQGAPPTAADSLLRLAEIAYDDGNFDGAELAALRGLRLATDLDQLGKLKFHTLLAFVYVARDQLGNARQEFKWVLSVNPAYAPDPVQTSPKILDVYRDARNEYMLQVASEPAIYRMPQADVRLAASWRSLVLPSWGQFYKKQEVKGAVLVAVQLLSLVALGFEQAELNRRRDDYRNIKAYGDSGIDDAYNEYRRAYQTRNAVGYVALGVYLFNYFDALYYPVSHKK